MVSSNRFVSALCKESVDRVPVVPKIWVDFAAKVTNTDLKDVIQDPLTALRIIALASEKLGFDAVRQFYFPAKKIIQEDDGVFEINSTGEKIGKIDMSGGLATHLFDPEDYRVQDPYTMAYCHSWVSPQNVVNSIDDAKAIAIPDASIYDELGWAKMQKQIINEFGDNLCLIGDLGSATMSFYIGFRDINNAMMDLILQPELVHAVIEKGTQIAIAKGKYWLDNGIRVLRLNDSTGNMSLMSPHHWQEFVYPYIKTVCDELHNYNRNALIYCHICGNVLPVIDKLVDAGLDCIGPLDPLGGFTVSQARQAAGKSIPLMGGVNTLSLLNNTPEQIRQEAIECIKGSGDKGNYILSSGCVVPRGCSTENLIALVEASKMMSVV